MAAPELVLRFPTPDLVSVAHAGIDSGPLPFVNPLTDQDRKDLRWYLETYGPKPLEGDDPEARRVEGRLREIGKALFKSVLGELPAARPFTRFQDTAAEHRVLTVDTQSAAILALPWELLHDPSPNGTFLFRERPHISVRRCISGATDGRPPFPLHPKDRLHLLFVVSRPTDAGFIDPRADPGAVLDALDRHAPGRVTWEFLRPPTLDALTERLDDDTLPPVDILHFDGHGVFHTVSEDDAERDPSRFGRSVLSEIQRERTLRGLARDGDARAAPVGLGFLLFERADGRGHLISARDLSDNLHRARVGLVVLSACQTAALDAEGEPMASVAGRLTATGIPSVIAMTHSVLADTTRDLFGRFYASLARGRGIAGALDDARAWLANHPEKTSVRRGGPLKPFKLQDWFLPALFHSAADGPLLAAAARTEGHASAPKPVHNLRDPHEAGFFGRRRELWQIERWLAAETRRISIVGFGGQGKTELGQEAGRWTLRTGLFRRAVFVDYTQVQTDDPVRLAIATVAAVLGESLAEPDAAAEALAAEPTLLILDNLESLPADGLARLLDTAADWSRPERGATRVLLTSRSPDFGHADYRIQDTRIHRRILLQGLGSRDYPDDALNWCAALLALPGPDDAPALPAPARDDLIELFGRVAFHPLSIAVLAQQLRWRSPARLAARLADLLADPAVPGLAREGTPASLVASLKLSMDRLSEEQRRAVGRLGVFQGGAMESELLEVTGLGEWQQADGERERLEALLAALEGGEPRVLLALAGVDLPEGVEIPPELLTQIPDGTQRQRAIAELRARLATRGPEPAAHPDPWPELRRQLELAALIEAERIPGVGPPFIRFHPTLAPLLWTGLDGAEREQLTLVHRRRYYVLAGYLYDADRKNPDEARAIALRELPNLLQAVEDALEASAEHAADFVNAVNWFLTSFGRTREAAGLNRRVERKGDEQGSAAWRIAYWNRGEELLLAGHVAEAAECFGGILRTLDDIPNYWTALALRGLGRCYAAGGRPDLAEVEYLRGIEVTDALEQSDLVKRHRATLLTDLGDVLQHQGKFAEARERYDAALEIVHEIGDLRSERVIQAQLGMLALENGDIAQAKRRYRDALQFSQRLKEPSGEAAAHHQLGRVFQEAKEWELAEWHYRESAALKEKLGDLAGAARTWNQLGFVAMICGRADAAETWYRKAVSGMQNPPTGDRGAKSLTNLAAMLKEQPDRLAEAKQLAEESLSIKRTLDRGVAEIWKTYEVLAQIAESESCPNTAAQYRRLARESRQRFVGRQFVPVIRMVLDAVASNAAARFATDLLLRQARAKGGEAAEFARVIERILAGERDPDALCRDLSFGFTPMVETILNALADPSTLDALLADPDAGEP